MSHVGIDFGTTNSAVAIAEASGPSRLVPLTVGTQVFETFRSVLFFEKQEDRLGTTLAHWAGPEAIEAYLDSEGEGRFVQSVKSYLASKDFTGTNILGKQFGIEPLVSLILKDLKAKAETSAGPLPQTIVVGRPAHFVGEPVTMPRRWRWSACARPSDWPECPRSGSSLSRSRRPTTTKAGWSVTNWC